jgi:hypothetical protein
MASREAIDFAHTLNKALLKQGATNEAAKFMTPLQIPKVLEAFDFVDPYVQAVLLQSVILLSMAEFRAIAHDYTELVDRSATSPDEWVRRKAAEFRNYPELAIDPDVADFDFSCVAGQEQAVLRPVQRTKSKMHDPIHFSLREEVRPPSQSLPPPKLPQPQQAAPKQPQVQPMNLSIADPKPAPQKVRPAAPMPEREKDKTKKKGKTAMTLEELQRSQAERADDWRYSTSRRK